MAGEATSAPAILIGGPTAAGKSPLALAIARAHDGVVINADSMQVYGDLSVLTARPSAHDVASVPHRLFGHVDAGRRHSVAAWLVEAREAAAAAAAEGRLPILVGGTGLYLAAFVEGVSPMPEIPPAVREEVTGRMASEGSAVLHGELARLDPVIAGRLPAGDRQRIQRALEVVLATGEPLSAWQGRPREGAWPGPVLQLVLDPERGTLRAVCDARFETMMAAGALDEVAALAGRGLDPALPAMRALGVPPLLAHLAGALDLDEAVARAKAATRQYAKRQATWFRNQAPEARTFAELGAPGALEAVSGFLLTARGSRA